MKRRGTESSFLLLVASAKRIFVVWVISLLKLAFDWVVLAIGSILGLFGIKLLLTTYFQNLILKMKQFCQQASTFFVLNCCAITKNY